MATNQFLNSELVDKTITIREGTLGEEKNDAYKYDELLKFRTQTLKRKITK